VSYRQNLYAILSEEIFDSGSGFAEDFTGGRHGDFKIVIFGSY
jgi:hypothetical protein